MKKPEMEWNKDIGFASCVMKDNYDRVHVGIAQCHEYDFDMQNKITGLQIAYQRAEIASLKSHIQDELKPRLRALHQLYYSMNRSKKFNSNSYENKMLKRQIHIIKNDIITAKEMLVELEENLKIYLDEKEKLYQKIRNKREKASKD